MLFSLLICLIFSALILANSNIPREVQDLKPNTVPSNLALLNDNYPAFPSGTAEAADLIVGANSVDSSVLECTPDASISPSSDKNVQKRSISPRRVVSCPVIKDSTSRDNVPSSGSEASTTTGRKVCRDENRPYYVACGGKEVFNSNRALSAVLNCVDGKIWFGFSGFG